jgi:hypothetical protein
MKDVVLLSLRNDLTATAVVLQDQIKDHGDQLTERQKRNWAKIASICEAALMVTYIMEEEQYVLANRLEAMERQIKQQRQVIDNLMHLKEIKLPYGH